jgi:histidinol-phosphate aminotransferase
MASRITDRTRLVVVCNPNNPTGTAVSTQQLRAFLDLVPADCLVALDEAYAEYVRAPATADGLALAERHPNLVVLRTFSKAYGLAGLRVGYLVGSPDVVRELSKAQLAYAVNSVAQRAALAALDLEDELRQRVDATVAERTRVRAALLAQGLPVPASQGNFVWLELGKRAQEFGAWCTARGIAVRTYDDEGVRVSIGSADDNDALLAVTAAWATERDDQERAVRQ